MKKNIKICISGGHLTPALAVIDEVQRLHPDWTISFIGRKRVFKRDTNISQECKEIEKRHIRFFPITAGKFRRDISIQTLISLLWIPIGLIQSCWFMVYIRPDCILTFGGFIALPVALAGWLFGIPVVTHEQTHTLGLANRLMVPFVTSCLLSFEDTKHAPNTISRYTGLPLRREIVHPSSKLSFPLPSRLPIVYITGGSTGAVSMNEFIFPIIPMLVKYAVVVHQTGVHSLKKAESVKDSLLAAYRNRYIPMAYIEGIDVGWIMHNMLFLIGRSGGNTVAETAFVQKPAIFIPLPWAGQGEQEQNARWYEKMGSAYIVYQDKQSTENIQKIVITLLKQKPKQKVKAPIFDDGTRNLIKHLELLIANNEK